RITQERLEAEYSPIRQRFDLVCISRNESAEEAAINPQPPLGRSAFGGEGGSRGRHRVAVERHVDEAGDTACGGRRRRRVEAFQIGGAGIVDMDMNIEESRKDRVVADVLDV